MIQPKQTTIGEILTLSQHLVVPKYQRGYEWDKSQASEFLEDLQSEAGRGLFLGTFIFDIVDELNKRITIVDGQQRLTTILLLLIACRNRAKEIGVEGVCQQTQQRITFVDPATARPLGAKLVASESIRELFEKISDAPWIGSFPVKVGSKTVKRQANRIRPIFEFFYHTIDAFDQTSLSALLEGIYRTRVIRIDIQGDEEAFSIFERTNARGMDLEVSDLLKNYLYQQDVPELDDKWKEIIKNSDGTILKMLKHFYVSRKGYVNKSELYKKIREYCKAIGGADKLVEELREFSRFYAAIRREEGPVAIKKYFDSIDCKVLGSEQDKYERVHISLQGLRLFKISQIYPVISAALACFVRNGASNNRSLSKIFVRLLEDMEKYHFINNAICDRIGNEVEKLYANYCVKFATSDDFEKTTNELIGSLKKQLASKEEFSTRFREISYSPETIPVIAYIFDRMSNSGLDPGERVPIFNPTKGVRRKSHNIEHFYPQKPNASMKVDLQTLDAVDNVGNLLAISFKTNSSLGNLSPKEKLDKLKGELGKRIENLRYVQAFIQRYEKASATWDRSEIEKRAIDLASEAYGEVWRIN